MPINATNVAEEGPEEAERWLATNLARTSTVPSDFGLSAIAKHFGKSNAVALYWAGAAKEEEGEVNDAIVFYRKAYRLWPGDKHTHTQSTYHVNAPPYHDTLSTHLSIHPVNTLCQHTLLTQHTH